MSRPLHFVLRAHRAGFSLVELIVALVLLSVAAAALGAALSGDRRIRELADGEEHAADRARVRLEAFAALPCLTDSSGTNHESWGSDAWTATVFAGSWRLRDSLLVRRSAAPVIVEARIACPD